MLERIAKMDWSLRVISCRKIMDGSSRYESFYLTVLCWNAVTNFWAKTAFAFPTNGSKDLQCWVNLTASSGIWPEGKLMLEIWWSYTGLGDMRLEKVGERGRIPVSAEVWGKAEKETLIHGIITFVCRKSDPRGGRPRWDITWWLCSVWHGFCFCSTT